MSSNRFPDDGEDGGTFWTSFGPATPEATPMEQLLADPDCSVEALLDLEDIIQEFKACNERLMGRLCQPDAIRLVISYITCEPPEGASKSRCFRNPFIAVELLTVPSADKVFEVLIGREHPELLDSLWDFLEVTPADEVNPVLAGYFARMASALYSKHPGEVVANLRRRASGVNELMERFLERLHLRSIAEFFARLLTADQHSHVLFPVDNLISRLLERLEDDGDTTDLQENITLIILKLLQQKDSLCYADELMAQLADPVTVRSLADRVFCGRSCVVQAANSILSSIVFHAYVVNKSSSTAVASPTLSPLSPPPSNLLEEDSIGSVNEENLQTMEAVSEGVPQRVSQEPPRSPATSIRGDCPAMLLEARGAAVMHEISSHLPRMRELLDASISNSLTLQMPIGAVSAVGSLTFEVINLLTLLVRTGCPDVLEVVLREQLLPKCLEVFFRHPWSSLLHNSVKLLVSEVLSSLDGPRPKLAVGLLREGGLLQRLVSEYSAEASEVRSGQRRRHSRVGYMGHLHSICIEVRDFSMRSPECSAVLAAVDGWRDVVLPALDATTCVQAEELGGGVHQQDRSLASSGSNPSTEALAAVKSTLEADFVLDDNPTDFNVDSNDFDAYAAKPDIGRGHDEVLSGDPLDQLSGYTSGGNLQEHHEPADATEGPPLLSVLQPVEHAVWSTSPQEPQDLQPWNAQFAAFQPSEVEAPPPLLQEPTPTATTSATAAAAAAAACAVPSGLCGEEAGSFWDSEYCEPFAQGYASSPSAPPPPVLPADNTTFGTNCAGATAATRDLDEPRDPLTLSSGRLGANTLASDVRPTPSTIETVPSMPPTTQAPSPAQTSPPKSTSTAAPVNAAVSTPSLGDTFEHLAQLAPEWVPDFPPAPPTMSPTTTNSSAPAKGMNTGTSLPAMSGSAPAQATPPPPLQVTAQQPWANFGDAFDMMQCGDTGIRAASQAQARAAPVPQQSAMHAWALSVGTENLFALLGENEQAEPSHASTGSPPAIDPAPTPPPLQPSPPQPWGTAQPAPPPGPPPTLGSGIFDGFFDPLTPLTPASPSVQAPAPSASRDTDRSWVADFDPLFQPAAGNTNSTGAGQGIGSGSGIASADASQSQGGQRTAASTSVDLASLAQLWPS